MRNLVSVATECTSTYSLLNVTIQRTRQVNETRNWTLGHVWLHVLEVPSNFTLGQLSLTEGHNCVPIVVYVETMMIQLLVVAVAPEMVTVGVAVVIILQVAVEHTHVPVPHAVPPYSSFFKIHTFLFHGWH